VAIVSQALARQSFPDRDPVGLHLLVKDNPAGFRTIRIVGVAGDVRHGSLEAPAEPHLYVPYHQTHRSLLVWLAQTQFLVVRASGDPRSLATAAREAVQAVDPNVASATGRLSGHYVDNAAAARRFSLVLLGLFCATALGMAGVGIYGVVAYAVAQRTRETGVRLALGAARGDIALLIVGDGLKRTALGLAVGLVASFAAARALGALLFGVGATDPATYSGVVAVLVAVTVIACGLPAWRAARVDPVKALRLD
jgi:predicted lysophospholipase L1 biosynthesis ABC-type transport system permease subunit